MKNFKKALCLVLALAMTVAMLAACGSKDDANTDGDSAKKTFIMGVDPEYPPFSYLGDDGKFTGFDVEICQAVCDELGWDLKVFGVNWDQKLVQLDSNECDCIWSGMTILDSMKDAGYVISKPYYDNTQVIMVKEGSDIKSSADLAGKSVAVQLGTSGESLLSEGGDLESLAKTFGSLMTCDSFLKCFTELGGGAVDAVIVDKPVATSYVQQNAGFTILDEELGAEQYGIAFRSGDQELCDTVQAAVQKLVDNGTYAKIAEKYPDIVNNLLFLSK
ncbi:MAG: transporter substrate-binding domain-containing protein [Firmicutes bacterium]|nr:transporter substrate-binding domain-containing protein [Bacillota bacterium]